MFYTQRQEKNFLNYQKDRKLQKHNKEKANMV